MMKVAIGVENLNCTDVLVLQSQRYHFPTSRKCKKFNISLFTVRAEMLYLQKYLKNFQTLSFGWKMSKVAIVVENFNCTDFFGFAIATLQLFQHLEYVKISIFPFTLSQQNAIFSKVLNEFSKIFFWLKDE